MSEYIQQRCASPNPTPAAQSLCGCGQEQRSALELPGKTEPGTANPQTENAPQKRGNRGLSPEKVRKIKGLFNNGPAASTPAGPSKQALHGSQPTCLQPFSQRSRPCAATHTSMRAGALLAPTCQPALRALSCPAKSPACAACWAAAFATRSVARLIGPRPCFARTAWPARRKPDWAGIATAASTAAPTRTARPSTVKRSWPAPIWP